MKPEGSHITGPEKQHSEGGTSTWWCGPHSRFRIVPESPLMDTIHPSPQAKGLTLTLGLSFSPSPTHTPKIQPISKCYLQICFESDNSLPLYCYYPSTLLQYFSWLIHSCCSIMHSPIKQPEWPFKHQSRPFILPLKSPPVLCHCT